MCYNGKNKNYAKVLLPIYVAITIIGFALILVFPTSREIFKGLSSNHPYIMGFIKFALLATAGELIASSIRAGKATVPVKIISRFVI